LSGTTKNSPFCVLGPFSWAIDPLFWGSMDIYKEYDSLYILERNDKKTHCFCVYGRFRELFPIVLVFYCCLMVPSWRGRLFFCVPRQWRQKICLMRGK
jgi:hypothetical protein